ncbi:hypothetical protein QE357_003508 [Siphonobacter sp. BAB-5404]|nr:hypothetical protein [Siphonobacter sp. SORGH_AS_0500]
MPLTTNVKKMPDRSLAGDTFYCQVISGIQQTQNKG